MAFQINKYLEKNNGIVLENQLVLLKEVNTLICNAFQQNVECVIIINLSYLSLCVNVDSLEHQGMDGKKQHTKIIPKKIS